MGEIPHCCSSQQSVLVEVPRKQGNLLKFYSCSVLTFTHLCSFLFSAESLCLSLCPTLKKLKKSILVCTVCQCLWSVPLVMSLAQLSWHPTLATLGCSGWALLQSSSPSLGYHLCFNLASHSDDFGCLFQETNLKLAFQVILQEYVRTLTSCAFCLHCK